MQYRSFSGNVMLLALICFCSFCRGENIATVGLLDKTPKIDGKVLPLEWKAATRLVEFSTIEPEAVASEPKTVAYMGYDDSAVYIAFECQQKVFLPVMADALKDEGQVWNSDSVEVIFSHPSDHKVIYHFIGNVAGKKLDEKGSDADAKWNGEWSFAAVKTKTGWSAEFRIPFSTIVGVPRDVMGFNLARNFRGASLVTSTWSPTARVARQFGALHLSSNGPLVQAFGPTSPETIGQNVTIINPSKKDSSYKLYVKTVRKSNMQTLNEQDEIIVLKPGQQKTVDGIFKENPGTYEMSVLVTDAATDQPVFRQQWISRIPQALNVELRTYLFNEKIQPMIYLNSSQIPADAEVVFMLKDGEKALEGKTFKVSEVPDRSMDPRWMPSMGKQISCIFDISKLTAGDYSVEVRLAGSGKSAGAKKAYLYFTKPPKPEWLNSKVGLENVVPHPWTPVKVSGHNISMWGREYQFGNSAMPVKIITQGQDILAGPVELTGKFNDKSLELVTTETKVVDSTDFSCKVVTKQKSDGLELDTTATVEFDGLIRFDVDVKIPENGTLEKLSLQVPFKQQFATLLQGQPEDPVRGVNKPWPSWTGASNGLLPDRTVHGPYTEFIWLGNDNLGLTWCCESLKNWNIKNKSHTITVKKRSDSRVLQINFIDAPPRDKTFRLTFVLQATPVRPAPKYYKVGETFFHYDFYYERKPTDVSQGSLTYPANGNINTQQGSINMFFGGTRENPHADDSRLLWLNFADGTNVVLSWNRKAALLTLRRDNGKTSETLLTVKDFNRLPGNLSLRWNSDGCAIYSCGKELAKSAGRLLEAIELDGGRMMFSGGVYLDGIAVCSSDRVIEGLLQDMEKSADILLFDRLDEIKGRGTVVPQTIPAKSAKQPGFSGGRIYGFADIAEKAGDGKKLWLSSGVENLNWFEQWRRVHHWDYIMFFEYWGEFEGLPRTEKYDKDLKKFVEYAHKAGLKVILDITAVLGDLAPEVRLYGDEIFCEPKENGFTRWIFDPQNSYYQALVGNWQDYFAYLCDKLIRRYDIDGLYFDGSHYPRPDKNIWHGTGYIDENGKLQPTNPMFEYRKWMRRIRNIANAYKPDFRLDIHCLTEYSPTISFADSILTGEQYLMIADDYYNGSIRKCLKLDSVRANFIGKQFGFQPEFYTDSKGIRSKVDNAVAIGLVNGVQLRREQFASVTVALKEVGFDIYSPNWHPYYENSDKVKVTPDWVKFSYFRAEDGRMLMMMANFSEKPQRAVIEFKDTKGLPIGHSIRNRITGKWQGYFKDKIEVVLPPWEINVWTTE